VDFCTAGTTGPGLFPVLLGFLRRAV
jgi:hypothetical protein